MTDTRPVALRAVDDDGDPLLEIPARLKWRRSGRDMTALAVELVEAAVAVFRCDPLDLRIVDMADVRYYADVDGPVIDVEVVVTTRHDLAVAARLEGDRARVYRIAREDAGSVDLGRIRSEFTRDAVLADDMAARLAARNRRIAQEHGR